MNSVRLQLPEKIYAVPNVETNVYFDNIVLLPNPDIFVFEVDCAKGRNGQKKWRFTPSDGDAGEYAWHVKVLNGAGQVADGMTSLVVTPADAGKGKKSPF